LLSNFKYRIYPKDEQEVLLRCTLVHLCDLYNELRSEKVNKYKENKINLSKTNLRRLALETRRTKTDLKRIHSQVVQNVADRVSHTFNNFLEKRARFPKNKKYKNYRSFTYPQSGFNIVPTHTSGHRLYLSGIGEVRMFIHRPMSGKVNRVTIKKEVGEWYAIFLTETVSAKRLPSINDIPEDRIRGGDMGLEKFLVLDDSQSMEYPAFLRISEPTISSLQKSLSKKKRGSKRWKMLAFRLARLHLHVKRQREDYQNKLISTLLNKETDMLVLEKLVIEKMLRNHNLAKSIADTSFGKFTTKCINKSKMLGKHVLFVDPWGTSQFCYNCLEWVPKDLNERQHKCPKYGANLSRDLRHWRTSRI
jgi:putative transposase